MGTVAKGSNVLNAAFHKQSIYGHVFKCFFIIPDYLQLMTIRDWFKTIPNFDSMPPEKKIALYSQQIALKDSTDKDLPIQRVNEMILVCT
jgi:hypothetical protein